MTTVRFPPDLWPMEWETGETGWTGAEDSGEVVSATPLALDEDTLEWGCNSVNTAWTYAVRTTGWADGATLDIYGETWSEQHAMLLMDISPAGAWDQYQSGPLPQGTPQEEWQTTVNSAFDCTLDASTLTFIVRARDRVGNLADCVMWGADPTAGPALRSDPEVVAIGGCRWLAGR